MKIHFDNHHYSWGDRVLTSCGIMMKEEHMTKFVDEVTCKTCKNTVEYKNSVLVDVKELSKHLNKKFKSTKISFGLWKEVAEEVKKHVYERTYNAYI